MVINGNKGKVCALFHIKFVEVQISGNFRNLTLPNLALFWGAYSCQKNQQWGALKYIQGKTMPTIYCTQNLEIFS